MMPLIEVRGVSMHFAGRGALTAALRRAEPEVLTAVDGVDLAVYAGEALGLVGESGCGKTTLARCLIGLYQPTAGTIRFDGEEVGMRRSPRERRRMQMVFQDPYSSLNPRLTVRQTLAELLRVHAIVPRGRIEARCRELLALVGMTPEFLDVYPRQLSGGQRQRVSIARALALDPEVLIADEPVSALDVSVQAAVLNLLAELRATMGLTLILIAHDLSVVRYVCDRVAVMYLGRIVELAESDALFADPRHPYTRGLLDAVPSIVPGRTFFGTPVEGDPPSPYAIPRGCRFHPRCPLCQPVCQTDDPPLALSPHAPSHLAACHFAWPGGIEQPPRATSRTG